MDYRSKYIKYYIKYRNLKQQKGGASWFDLQEQFIKEDKKKHPLAYVALGLYTISQKVFNSKLRGLNYETDEELKAPKKASWGTVISTPGVWLIEHKTTIDQLIDELKNAIERSPAVNQNMKAYRGVNNIYKDFKVGDIFSDPAFISTSKDKNHAAFYAVGTDTDELNTKSHYCCLLEINIPVGTHAIYASYMYKGQTLDEYEMLLPPDTIMKVTNIKDENIMPREYSQSVSIRVIEVDVIDKKDLDDKTKKNIKTLKNITGDFGHIIGAGGLRFM
jgi:hypothetical protein